MSKWIETPAFQDRMPVDISFVFEDEKPAGKHGFLKRNGEHFAFEDGTRVKFWGVCLAGAANFPEHPVADMWAQRLSQAGVNCVRTHWMDTDFDTPNIFAFTKGKRLSDTRHLDPRSMDRLDYMIAAFKKEGIYIYLDNMTYRKFQSGDDVPYAWELDHSAKPYSITNRRLIDLQKEYMTQLWTHVNPYTGLAYKDEPAIVLTDITNECDLFSKQTWKKSEYYQKEYRALFGAWLKEKGMDYDWENCDMDAEVQPLIDFKYEVMKGYFGEMRDHLKSLGVKIPVTGTTWIRRSPSVLRAQEDMDYTDGHHYYYDWRWSVEQKICMNEKINGYPYICAKLGILKTPDRPYFVSEWDMPWPNDFRAESPIYYAAVAALQDWDGIALFGYSHGSHLENMHILGKEFSTDTIGSVPFEAGVLSSWNDPAKFGLFYHGALLVRRGDLAPAEKKVAVKFESRETFRETAWQTGLEQHRLRSIFDESEAEGFDQIITDGTALPRENPNILASDHGQMHRSLSAKVGVIDTPRTKVIYGNLAKPNFRSPASSAYAKADGFEVKAINDFGVVALSSLTDQPIETSDNMLLSAISRARNTDMQSAGDELIDFGRAPILSEVIEAKIRIRTDRKDLKVFGVNAEGYYSGEAEVSFEDGYLSFEIGGKFPAIYYLIVAE